MYSISVGKCKKLDAPFTNLKVVMKHGRSLAMMEYGASTCSQKSIEIVIATQNNNKQK
jgi:hypothetical protein